MFLMSLDCFVGDSGQLFVKCITSEVGLCLQLYLDN